MAENLKQLRRRVRSVGNVGKITRAMEMVSAAKLRRAEGVLKAGRPYARKLQELLGRLSGSASVAGNPLFERRESPRTTLVVFTADRGLCGAFNTNLISAAGKWAEKRGRDNLELYCVGRKGLSYFEKRDWEIAGSVVDMGGNLSVERSDALSAEMLDRYLTGGTDEVVLLYSAYISTSSFRPTFERFLSIEAESFDAEETAREGRASRQIDYIFEPSPQVVFDSLLPLYLRSKTYITFAEQFTSEHSARMLAMHNATQNCEELFDSMTLRLNKARQAAITRDLLDIVGGAEAIQG
jgi:F-type H+-transporting ATPase subunit gamma